MWARLGAGYKPNTMVGGGVSSFLEQTIPIPTSPATLSFRLRIINAPGPTGEISVRAGDSEIFAATDGAPGFASYAPVTIDVSSLAGAAPAFRFEGFSAYDPIGALDSFDVDDISLITVDPSPPVTTSPDPRCKKLRAKLKKAKRKGNKRKARKIRKRMRALGC
jgi:hypothetical protein